MIHGTDRDTQGGGRSGFDGYWVGSGSGRDWGSGGVLFCAGADIEGDEFLDAIDEAVHVVVFVQVGGRNTPWLWSDAMMRCWSPLTG